MPGSVSGDSVRSYKRVGRTSEVDESLFGSARRRESKYGDEGKRSEAGMLDRSSLRRIGATIAAGNAPPNGLVISRSELNKYRSMSTIKTAEQAMLERKAAQLERESKMKAAQARKKRMMQLEEEGKKHRVKSDIEIIKEMESNALLSAAQKKLDEQEDQVKTMNRMVMYAQCVAVRDKQLEDKKQRKARAKDEERLLDLRMEIDRLKKLQEEEEKRKVVRARRMEDAKVIREQKADKERRRILAQEALELEGQQILKQIEARKEQEKIEAAKKREEGRKLLAEVLKANQAAIDAKKNAKLYEIEENERIMEYIRQQELKARQREEEEEMRKRVQEEETMRVRALQEKAADTRAEEDARRALRHQQEAERKLRNQVRMEEEKRKRDMRELAEAREAQMRFKAIADAEEAARQKIAHAKVIADQREMMAREAEVEKMKQREHAEHARMLQQQIEDISLDRQRNKDDRMAMAEQIRAEKVKKKYKLEQIRKEKVESLRASGVPEKYLAELQRMKITIA